MRKHIALLCLALALLFGGTALANGLLHMTGSIAEGGDYTASDAVFLPSGELLLVGSRRLPGEEASKPWAAKVDAQRAEIRWSYVLEESADSLQLDAVALLDGGFAMIGRSPEGSYLLIADEAGEVSGPVRLGGYVEDIAAAGGNLIVAGSSLESNAAWMEMVSPQGETQWGSDGVAPGAFTCVAATDGGILLGGYDAQGALAAMVEYDGDPLWRVSGLGSMDEVSDIAFDGERVVVAGNRHAGEDGDAAGVAALLTAGGEWLQEMVLEKVYEDQEESGFEGVYIQESGNGYTLYGYLSEKLDYFPVEECLLVYLVDKDLAYINEYHPPFGINAVTKKVLRDAEGAVWIIGQGNSTGAVLRWDVTEDGARNICIGTFNFVLLDAS